MMTHLDVFVIIVVVLAILALVYAYLKDRQYKRNERSLYIRGKVYDRYREMYSQEFYSTVYSQEELDEINRNSVYWR
jgi:hypothetical protein